MTLVLVMDYIHPVFVTACDLPNVFKGRLVRGCVKLATITEGDHSYLRKNRCNWFNAMSTACANSPLEKQLHDIVDKDLHKGDDATHFWELHGSGMHGFVADACDRVESDRLIRQWAYHANNYQGLRPRQRA